MIRKFAVAALLGGSAFIYTAPAVAAQEQPAQETPEPTEPDTSDAAADEAIQSAAPIDGLQAKIELLQAQVEALQDALETVKTAQSKVVPSWKGAPVLEDKDAGWSFKPRGRIQYDAGYVSNPDDDPNGSLITRNLGFNTRARRIRLGAEGTIPGGFGYKFEADFANASVGFGDVVLTYAPSGKPYSFTIGNHETLNGLEQITSSRFISFMERAAFDDAFINTRRIGVSAGLVNSTGDLRFNAGIFAAHSIDSTLDNEGWIGAARAVYAPVMGGNQLHFGANYQHREFQSNNCTPTSSSNAACLAAQSSSGTPSTNQTARYRARPFSQTTDVRFVDTGAFAAKSDDIFGVEAAGIFKSLHVAAEGQYLISNAYRRGDKLDFSENNLNRFPGDTVSFLVPGGKPSFWGGYVEAGYFLTGETRGYKNGTWDRTKVLNPFSKGGWGAIQLNGRVDYLDLDSDELKSGFTNNFVDGTSSVSNGLTRGGKQLGLLASVVWIPEDWMRFYLQYSRSLITGGPLADEVSGQSSSSADIDEYDYGVDFVGTRAQIDF